MTKNTIKTTKIDFEDDCNAILDNAEIFNKLGCIASALVIVGSYGSNTSKSVKSMSKRVCEALDSLNVNIDDLF